MIVNTLVLDHLEARGKRCGIMCLNGVEFHASTLANMIQLLRQLPTDEDGVILMWGDYVEARGKRWYVRDIGRGGMIEVDNEQGSRFWRLARKFRKCPERA